MGDIHRGRETSNHGVEQQGQGQQRIGVAFSLLHLGWNLNIRLPRVCSCGPNLTTKVLDSALIHEGLQTFLRNDSEQKSTGDNAVSFLHHTVNYAIAIGLCVLKQNIRRICHGYLQRALWRLS